MFYFSEIYGKKVYSRDGSYLGRLKDMYFLPIETPLITKVVIKNNKKEELVAPAHLLKIHNGRGLVMSDSFRSHKKNQNEASILKNLQDKQILDLDGEKIIRANDVAIQEKPGYTVAGIDIGAFGVFRWIGLAKLASKILTELGIQYTSEFLAWNEIQPLEATRGKIVVKQEKEKLQKIQPEDLADYLEQTTTVNALKILKLMDPELSARVIADINTGFQSELFKSFTPHESAEIISLIDPDEAVDILLTFDEVKRERVLSLIDHKKQKSIQHLIKHAGTSIGHLMTTDFITVHAASRVKTALAEVKTHSTEFADLFYVYTVNRENQLVGVVSLHDLLLCPPDLHLYKVMVQNVVVAHLTTPKEIATQKMLKYHIESIPVVDDSRRMIGVVTLGDIVQDLFEKVIEEP
jgi:CBS domain-containing protein/sporulation protein YlmC with PRC-barrel domain